MGILSRMAAKVRGARSGSVIVRVPATTANLGPGFDCLGVALKLYNKVTVQRLRARPCAELPPMMEEAAERLFWRARKRIWWTASVAGDVPVARGMGSSVTVRAGVLVGLNRLVGRPLTEAECMKLVVDLEGHPDNAIPAFLGGFCVCAGDAVLRQPVAPKLKFIAVVPEIEVEAPAARAVLPAHVSFQDAVHNGRQAALVAAAFATSRYELLGEAFRDRLHEPYRKHLLPGFEAAVAAAEKAGSLGAFLSGSGSTIVAVVVGGATICQRIMRGMIGALKAAGVGAQGMVLTADNDGLR